MIRQSPEQGGTRLDRYREWCELVFYCWRWLIILAPATAEAVAIVVAISEGRAPTFTFYPFS